MPVYPSSSCICTRISRILFWQDWNIIMIPMTSTGHFITATADRIKVILEDADNLIMSCGQEFDDVTEYQLFVRCLSEQTVVEDAVRRIKAKKDGPMGSSVLQNPSGPDATFREKAGKQYRGYVANVDEVVGENGSVVLDYQFEQNNYSDSQFLKDSLERNGSSGDEAIIVTDGAYFGEENSRLAQKQNVKLVTTALTGIEVPEIYADFLLSEDGTRVLKCPAGHTPKSSCYSNGGGGHIYVSFPKEQCMHCPHKEQGRVKVHKRVCSLTISATAQFRARTKWIWEQKSFTFWYGFETEWKHCPLY